MKKFESVTVDGKTYKLRLSINAMIAFEEGTGKNIVEIDDSFGVNADGSPNLGELRGMFHALLHDYHSELTLSDAGLLMGDIGYAAASELILETMKLAMPDAPTEKKLTQKAEGEASDA